MDGVPESSVGGVPRGAGDPRGVTEADPERSSRGETRRGSRKANPVGACINGTTVLLVLLFATPVEAQRAGEEEPPPRRVDLEVIHLTASWLFPVAEGWALGPQLGGGLFEQKTLLPSGDDFTSLVHIGAVASRIASPAASLDMGLRLGLAELRSRSCSGCLPEPYGALTFGVYYGGNTIRGGSRLMAGWVVEDGFFAWSPLILRFRF